MSKQAGNIILLGTVYGLCFYEQEGQYYVRRKPGPERKAFYKYKKYAVQRACSKAMVLAARICSVLYKAIGKERKTYSLFCQLQKKAVLYLKLGIPAEQAVDLLLAYLLEEGYVSAGELPDLRGLACGVLKRPFHSKSPSRKPGRLTGVKIRTAEGQWIRLYHSDEVDLLNTYCYEKIKDNDAWLSDFLEKRKKLPSYRFRYKRRRRVKAKGKTIVQQPGTNVLSLPGIIKLPGREANRVNINPITDKRGRLKCKAKYLLSRKVCNRSSPFSILNSP